MLPLLLGGCTSFKEYVHNGFKVGPNYHRPPAPVAPDWIDGCDRRLRKDCGDLSQWWQVLNDPILNDLVCCAYRQNLTLREAGYRVLEARAQLCIAVGNIFPQTQRMAGEYSRYATSRELSNVSFVQSQFNNRWDFHFDLAWELDFWGRFRRAIEANEATLEASVADYDDVLVTLLGDVAAYYVQMRILQQRIKYYQANVELQKSTLTIAEARFKGGTVSQLDVFQARSTMEQTQAQIHELEIALRQAENQLCILLGIPPENLEAKLCPSPIPVVPVEVIAGIPADLLRRRPDIRRAERQAAAQSAAIGIAESDFYPAITINGVLGYAARNFGDMFKPAAMNGNFGPSFQWNLLNYGRILNNVRYQEAKFQELVAAYQQAVLNGAREVENGLVTFLRAQERTYDQAASVDDNEKAVRIVLAQYEAGTVDFTRVSQVEQNLVLQQDVLAQARGEIALGLIQVYRALGGGWEIRCNGCQPGATPGPNAPQPVGPEPLAPGKISPESTTPASPVSPAAQPGTPTPESDVPGAGGPGTTPGTAAPMTTIWAPAEPGPAEPAMFLSLQSSSLFIPTEKRLPAAPAALRP